MEAEGNLSELIKWSRHQYSLENFVRDQGTTFPRVVQVVEGFCPVSEENAVENGQILILHTVQQEGYVVVKQQSGAEIIISASCPDKLCLVPVDRLDEQYDTVEELFMAQPDYFRVLNDMPSFGIMSGTVMKICTRQNGVYHLECEVVGHASPRPIVKLPLTEQGQFQPVLDGHEYTLKDIFNENSTLPDTTAFIFINFSGSHGQTEAILLGESFRIERKLEEDTVVATSVLEGEVLLFPARLDVTISPALEVSHGIQGEELIFRQQYLIRSCLDQVEELGARCVYTPDKPIRTFNLEGLAAPQPANPHDSEIPFSKVMSSSHHSEDWACEGPGPIRQPVNIPAVERQMLEEAAAALGRNQQRSTERDILEIMRPASKPVRSHRYDVKSVREGDNESSSGSSAAAPGNSGAEAQVVEEDIPTNKVKNGTSDPTNEISGNCGSVQVLKEPLEDLREKAAKRPIPKPRKQKKAMVSPPGGTPPTGTPPAGTPPMITMERIRQCYHKERVTLTTGLGLRPGNLHLEKHDCHSEEYSTYFVNQKISASDVLRESQSFTINESEETYVRYVNENAFNSEPSGELYRFDGVNLSNNEEWQTSRQLPSSEYVNEKDPSTQMAKIAKNRPYVNAKYAPKFCSGGPSRTDSERMAERETQWKKLYPAAGEPQSRDESTGNQPYTNWMAPYSLGAAVEQPSDSQENRIRADSSEAREDFSPGVSPNGGDVYCPMDVGEPRERSDSYSYPYAHFFFARFGAEQPDVSQLRLLFGHPPAEADDEEYVPALPPRSSSSRPPNQDAKDDSGAHSISIPPTPPRKTNVPLPVLPPQSSFSRSAIPDAKDDSGADNISIPPTLPRKKNVHLPVLPPKSTFSGHANENAKGSGADNISIPPTPPRKKIFPLPVLPPKSSSSWPANEDVKDVSGADNISIPPTPPQKTSVPLSVRSDSPPGVPDKRDDGLYLVVDVVDPHDYEYMDDAELFGEDIFPRDFEESCPIPRAIATPGASSPTSGVQTPCTLTYDGSYSIIPDVPIKKGDDGSKRQVASSTQRRKFAPISLFSKKPKKKNAKQEKIPQDENQTAARHVHRQMEHSLELQAHHRRQRDEDFEDLNTVSFFMEMRARQDKLQKDLEAQKATFEALLNKTRSQEAHAELRNTKMCGEPDSDRRRNAAPVDTVLSATNSDESLPVSPLEVSNGEAFASLHISAESAPSRTCDPGRITPEAELRKPPVPKARKRKWSHRSLSSVLVLRCTQRGRQDLKSDFL